MEHTQDASNGYVSLPSNTDSIVAAVIDYNSVPVRSLWHDYKLFGTSSDDKTLVTSFVDDGYAPTYRDLASGSVYQIRVVSMIPGVNIPSTSEATFDIKYRRYSDKDAHSGSVLTGGETVLESYSFNEASVILSSGSPHYDFTPTHSDVTEVLSINWSRLPVDTPLRVQATYKGVAGTGGSTDATKDLILADINTSNGSSRYRRFRVGGTDSSSQAHMLLKRRWVDVDSSNDLVHIPSSSILKHALLGKLAEDNSDIQRAAYHWGVVKELLEEDTDSYRGAAKPTLHIAPNGVGGGMSGMY